jgi:hypothetical protein
MTPVFAESARTKEEKVVKVDMIIAVFLEASWLLESGLRNV